MFAKAPGVWSAKNSIRGPESWMKMYDPTSRLVKALGLRRSRRAAPKSMLPSPVPVISGMLEPACWVSRKITAVGVVPAFVTTPKAPVPKAEADAFLTVVEVNRKSPRLTEAVVLTRAT
jgi:hypothetical protein